MEQEPDLAAVLGIPAGDGPGLSPEGDSDLMGGLDAPESMGGGSVDAKRFKAALEKGDGASLYDLIANVVMDLQEGGE